MTIVTKKKMMGNSLNLKAWSEWGFNYTDLADCPLAWIHIDSQFSVRFQGAALVRADAAQKEL